MMRFLLFVAVIGLIIWTWRGALVRKKEMSVSEAARILGVAEDADVETITDAHKRLIAKVHPDVGGNSELAAQVNLARETMLRRIKG